MATRRLESAQHAGGRRRLPALLVVDDERSVREFLTLLLEDEGYQVVTARDGVEALPLLSKARLDLVLLDIMMPEMDGRDVLRHMRKDRRLADVPVLAMSAVHQSDLGGWPVTGFVLKPFDMDELLHAIDAALSAARAGVLRSRANAPGRGKIAC